MYGVANNNDNNIVYGGRFISNTRKLIRADLRKNKILLISLKVWV